MAEVEAFVCVVTVGGVGVGAGGVVMLLSVVRLVEVDCFCCCW